MILLTSANMLLSMELCDDRRCTDVAFGELAMLVLELALSGEESASPDTVENQANDGGEGQTDDQRGNRVHLASPADSEVDAETEQGERPAGAIDLTAEMIFGRPGRVFDGEEHLVALPDSGANAVTNPEQREQRTSESHTPRASNSGEAGENRVELGHEERKPPHGGQLSAVERDGVSASERGNDAGTPATPGALRRGVSLCRSSNAAISAAVGS
jgi:hypothetical protein